MDAGRGRIRDMTKIKTKYFKTYQDYFIAQEKVRQQIEYGDEPVDLELEQKLVAETKWLSSREQRQREREQWTNK